LARPGGELEDRLAWPGIALVDEPLGHRACALEQVRAVALPCLAPGTLRSRPTAADQADSRRNANESGPTAVGGRPVRRKTSSRFVYLHQRGCTHSDLQRWLPTARAI